MKTGITKLNQLQVVVALLAFGLLAGASGSAAAAVGIEGQVQASGSPLAKFHGHALAGKRPRMTSK